MMVFVTVDGLGKEGAPDCETARLCLSFERLPRDLHQLPSLQALGHYVSLLSSTTYLLHLAC